MNMPKEGKKMQAENRSLSQSTAEKMLEHDLHALNLLSPFIPPHLEDEWTKRIAKAELQLEALWSLRTTI